MIAVVHLVWGPLGAQPLREFLASYRKHAAGVEHELVMLFNGVSDTQRPALIAELEGVEHRQLTLAQPMQDLAAYAQAVGKLDHQHICVLNSHSRIRVAGWLGALDGALQTADVGLVGASASWASMRSHALHRLGLPSPYRGVWPDRSTTAREFLELELERSDQSAPRGLISRLNTARALAGMTRGFSSFPAPHIRTNAFMAERLLLDDVLGRGLRRKIDAHRLESGQESITRQVERAGLRALVVDRSGRSFASPEWPDSKTFWQGDQGGLLVADNQTETYQQGDLARRRLLSRYAWGARAAPTAPAS